MINLQSILSLFDDKPTLLKWLKNVEAALAASVLTDVGVEQNGEDVTLTFNFEDGTKIVAPAFKFNKQITAANIENGHLIFTFADGSTEDAGNLFNGHVEVLSLSTPEIAVNTIGERASGQGVEFLNEVKVPSLNSNAAEISAKKPIIEDMTGYSFSPNSALETNGISLNYAGVCKNGNKLTLVISGVYTRLSTTTANPAIGNFRIPSSIYNLIFANSLGYVDNKLVAFSATFRTYMQKTITASKNTDNRILVQLFGANEDFVLDTSYAFRWELTLLLSNNLVA